MAIDSTMPALCPSYQPSPNLDGSSFSHRAVFCRSASDAQNFSSWGYMLADSEKRDLHQKKIRYKVAVGERHQLRPPKRSTCKPRYVCIFIYIYIHIMFRLRPCCSHFLKEDWIIINHNPWIRKRTNELYKRRHCFVKVCCDSSQKQARKTCRQRSLNPRLVATTEAPHSHHSRTFKSQVFLIVQFPFLVVETPKENSWTPRHWQKPWGNLNDSPEIFSVRHLVGDQIGVLLRWRAKVI